MRVVSGGWCNVLHFRSPVLACVPVWFRRRAESRHWLPKFLSVQLGCSPISNIRRTAVGYPFQCTKGLDYIKLLVRSWPTRIAGNLERTLLGLRQDRRTANEANGHLQNGATLPFSSRGKHEELNNTKWANCTDTERLPQGGKGNYRRAGFPLPVSFTNPKADMRPCRTQFPFGIQ